MAASAVAASRARILCGTDDGACPSREAAARPAHHSLPVRRATPRGIGRRAPRTQRRRRVTAVAWRHRCTRCCRVAATGRRRSKSTICTSPRSSVHRRRVCGRELLGRHGQRIVRRRPSSSPHRPRADVAAASWRSRSRARTACTRSSRCGAGGRRPRGDAASSHRPPSSAEQRLRAGGAATRRMSPGCCARAAIDEQHGSSRAGAQRDAPPPAAVPGRWAASGGTRGFRAN